MEKILEELKTYKLNKNASLAAANYLYDNGFVHVQNGFYAERKNYFTISDGVKIEGMENYLFTHNGEIGSEFDALNGYNYNMKIEYYTSNGIFAGIRIDLAMRPKKVSRLLDNYIYQVSLENSRLALFDGRYLYNYDLPIKKEELAEYYNSGKIMEYVIRKMQEAVSHEIKRRYDNSVNRLDNDLEKNKENPYFILRTIFGIKNEPLINEVGNYLKSNRYQFVSKNDNEIVFQNEEKKCTISVNTYGGLSLTEEGICLEDENPFIGKYIITDANVSNNSEKNINISINEYVYNSIEEENPICYYGRNNNEGSFRNNDEYKTFSFVLPKDTVRYGLRKLDGYNVMRAFNSLREAGIDFYCKQNNIKNKKSTFVI